MKRLFILSCLIVCITAIAHAQTYTQHLQQKAAGKGSQLTTTLRIMESSRDMKLPSITRAHSITRAPSITRARSDTNRHSITTPPRKPQKRRLPS